MNSGGGAAAQDDSTVPISRDHAAWNLDNLPEEIYRDITKFLSFEETARLQMANRGTYSGVLLSMTPEQRSDQSLARRFSQALNLPEDDPTKVETVMQHFVEYVQAKERKVTFNEQRVPNRAPANTWKIPSYNDTLRDILEVASLETLCVVLQHAAELHLGPEKRVVKRHENRDDGVKKIYLTAMAGKERASPHFAIYIDIPDPFAGKVTIDIHASFTDWVRTECNAVANSLELWEASFEGAERNPFVQVQLESVGDMFDELKKYAKSNVNNFMYNTGIYSADIIAELTANNELFDQNLGHGAVTLLK